MRSTRETGLWLVATLVGLGLAAPASTWASSAGVQSPEARSKRARAEWMARQHKERVSAAAPASAAVVAAEPFEDDDLPTDASDATEDAAESDWETGSETDPGESDQWDEPVAADEEDDVGDLKEPAEPEETEERGELEDADADWVEGAKSILDGLGRILKK